MSARLPFQVRRATTDDLPQLAALWEAAQFPVADLEKRFTEFQVAENAQGEIVAAIALQITAADGKIHSETFADFALSDSLRPRFWERLQSVAQGHGLFRLWTEEQAPYWRKDAGFSAPSGEALGRLPEEFGPPRPGWLAMRLKDETADPNLIEAQFAMFREAERARREKMLRWAHAVKIGGTVVAALLFIFALIVLISFFRNRR